MNTKEARRAALIQKFKEIGTERIQRMSMGWVRFAAGDQGGLEELLGELHTLKGEAKTLGFTEVHSIAHGLEDLLAANRDRAKEFSSAVLASLEGMGTLLDPASVGATIQLEPILAALGAGASQPEARQAPAQVPEVLAPARSTLRIPLERVGAIGELTGELQVSHRKAARLTQQLTAALGALEAGSELGEGQLARLRHQAAGLTEVLFRLGTHARQLDVTARELRLVPLSTILAPYLRMVLALSAEQGKQIRLVIEGDETQADTRVLEMLEEPVLHLLRNAVDHGLEMPGERLRAGKSADGQIKVSAQTIAGALRLIIEDDGQGLDSRALRARAVERGFLSAQAAESLTEAQAHELIFLNGFSTRDEVTTTSGRGLGMALVRRKLEQLGGTARVSPSASGGTRFELVAPISISMTRGLVLWAGGSPVVFPVAAVEEVRESSTNSVSELQGKPVLRRGDTVMPLQSLAALLARSTRGGPSEVENRTVIVHGGGRRSALTFRGEVFDADLIVKPIGRPLAGHPLLTGAAVLDDGTLAMVIDVAGLLGDAQAPSPGIRPERALVLLVEDSPIFQDSVGQILQRLGHAFELACDGLEALEALERRHFDVVITDIQMPRLDGLGLLARVRSRAASRELPMVVLSSLGSAEDKTRAAAAGANAYLIKAELTDELVANALSRFIG